MSVVFVGHLPGLVESGVTLRVKGDSAFLRASRFLARIRLPSGGIEWLVERPLVMPRQDVLRQPRYINPFGGGSPLWVSGLCDVLCEIMSTESGGITASARDATTGNLLWVQFIPVPNPAEWTEPEPAWPGAPTEEIYPFLASEERCLVVCLLRESRRVTNPDYGFTLPAYVCQTDATRFDGTTGRVIWSSSYPEVRVGIIERRAFPGLWSFNRRLGIIDFETGTNTVLYDSPNTLGWPVIDGDSLAVPWHSTSEIGVSWLNRNSLRSREGSTPQRGVRSTMLHSTGAGMALQSNDQGLWWLGTGEHAIWRVRAKPYIYRVHSCPDTDVFIGTDGNGGRLLGFQPDTGAETVNLKPALGGVGLLEKVPGHDVLVGVFRTSRSYSVSPRLLIFSMKDRHYDLENECVELLGTWEHGAVCRVGENGERLAIVDLRSMGTHYA
jgi:hypothetical protein